MKKAERQLSDIQFPQDIVGTRASICALSTFGRRLPRDVGTTARRGGHGRLNRALKEYSSAQPGPGCREASRCLLSTRGTLLQAKYLGKITR